MNIMPLPLIAQYSNNPTAIPFQDEYDLGSSGYDKTPDVVLDVPFATKDGTIINWIESKALFGSDEEHDIYLKKQYRSYRNRFSTGMVIYWFGFVSDLNTSSSKEGILIQDSFPVDEEIILMNPSYDIYSECQSDEYTDSLNAKQLDTELQYSTLSIDEVVKSNIISVTNSLENTRIY